MRLVVGVSYCSEKENGVSVKWKYLRDTTSAQQSWSSTITALLYDGLEECEETFLFFCCWCWVLASSLRTIYSFGFFFSRRRPSRFFSCENDGGGWWRDDEWWWLMLWMDHHHET